MGQISEVLKALSLLTRATATLWWAGLREAVQLQRCVVFFVDSPDIFEKTLKCFGLNVCIFCGSIGALHFFLQPAIQYLLDIGIGSIPISEAHSAGFLGEAFRNAAPLLEKGPLLLFQALWLLPMYILGIIVNCKWYSEIASTAITVQRERQRKQQILQQQGAAAAEAASQKQQPRKLRPPPPIAELAAQEIYKLLLFAVFFVQVLTLSFLPKLGTLVYFSLSSLLYAFYCFDYKWGMDNAPLAQRIAVIESNWAFFMGFGAPCVLLSMALPFYIGAGVVNFAYPLFVLVACDTDIGAATKKGREMVPARRLPWFLLARGITDEVIRRAGPQRHRQQSTKAKPAEAAAPGGSTRRQSREMRL